MRNELFNQRLQALLDARQAPELDAELRAQAALDDDCRQDLAAQELLFDGLSLQEMPELSPDFARRVVQLAKASPAPSPPRGISYRFIALGTCAAALLVLITAAVAWRPASTPPAAEVAGISAAPQKEATAEANANRSPAVQVAPDMIAAEIEPVDTANIAVETDLPERPLVAIGSQSPHDRYNGIYGALAALGQRFPTGVDAAEGFPVSTPEWFDEVAVGLKPVANSVGGAINVLRRNIPPVSRGGRQEKPQARFEGLSRSDLIC